MALTPAEEARLQAVELAVTQMQVLIRGMGSKNQLNRLRVLCGNNINKLTDKVTDLEAIAQELLDLARKLQ